MAASIDTTHANIWSVSKASTRSFRGRFTHGFQRVVKLAEQSLPAPPSLSSPPVCRSIVPSPYVSASFDFIVFDFPQNFSLFFSLLLSLFFPFSLAHSINRSLVQRCVLLSYSDYLICPVNTRVFSVSPCSLFLSLVRGENFSVNLVRKTRLVTFCRILKEKE